MLVLAAVMIGGFHLLEHVIQVLQRYFFSMPTGNGIAGSIADIEPVHLAYNVAYLALIVGTALTIERRILSRNPVAKTLLYGVVGLQTWHVLEHVVKMAQYVQLGGLNGVGGVFGIGPGAFVPLFPIPLLHFGYNLAVYLPFLFSAVILTRDSGMRLARDQNRVS